MDVSLKPEGHSISDQLVACVDPAALRHYWICEKAGDLGRLDPGLISCRTALALRASIIGLLTHSVSWRWSFEDHRTPDSATFRVAANWMFFDLKDLDLSALAAAINQLPFEDPTDDDAKRGIPSRRGGERMKYMARIKPRPQSFIPGDMAY